MENVVIGADTFENFLLETGTEALVLVVDATDVVGEIERHLICRGNDG